MNPKSKLMLVMGVLAVICVVTALAMNAPPFIYVVFIGIFAVLYFIFSPIYTQAAEQGNALIEAGMIIHRDAEFMKNAYIFSLSKIDMDDLIAAMKDEGLPFAELEWKTGTDAMTFRGSHWDAQMVKLESGEAGDQYQFKFLQWEIMPYGGATHFTQMNILLTAIEKAVLKLDPHTTVQTERIKIETNSRFI